MKLSRMCTLLLCALLAATSLAGCNDSETETSSTSPETASSNESASTDESTASADGELPEVTLPLTEEPVTFTYFQTTDVNAVAVENDYNDLIAYQELEKRTGVHIEWWMSSSADTQTNFNLMISSNQMADVTYGANLYSDGLEAGIDDGYFMDLTELVPEYMPYYDAIRNSNDKYRAISVTDSGRIAALYQWQEAQPAWIGVQVRQDWLDQLGMDMPVTYADWTEVLTAFKEELGVYAPLYLSGSGSSDLSNAWMSGFGVTYTWQLTADGKVAYGPYQDGWRDYVQQMHDWYAAGLIDPDFMTANAFIGDTTMIVTGKTGAWTSMYTMGSLYETTSDDPNIKISACVLPRVNEDDVVHLRKADQYYSGSPHAISANCENPELLLRWFDYLFTEEGSLLANYGIEGDTYTLGADGKPVWTDKVLHNDQYSFAQAQATYAMPVSAQPYWFDWSRELQGLTEGDVAMLDVWAQDDQDWILPTDLSLTASESVERSSIMTDIETLMQEQTAQMITGVLDIETNWDSYIAAMDKMGIQRATEITQAAYDRYLQR